MDYLLLQSGVQCLLYLLLSFFLIENATSTALKDSIDVENGVFLYSNFFRFPNHKLNSTPIESIIVDGADDCVEACTELVQCRSLNFGPILKVDNKSICHLLDADKFTSLDLFIESTEFHHYSFTAPCARNPCKNNGTCFPVEGRHDFLCACPAYYQGKICDSGYKNCAHLLENGFDENGVYPVAMNNKERETFNVYCDQENTRGGWTMVFKVVGGQPGPAGYIYQLWKSNDSLNEDLTNVLGISRSFPIPYKNRLVSSWQTTKPKEARVALYKNGNEVLSIVFNATNSDKENWFSADRVTFSPWEDLTSNPPTFFSLPGDSERSFYIAGPHISCNNDTGWLALTFQACNWERRPNPASIVYSKLHNIVKWDDYDNVGVADVLIVYIR